MAFRTKEQAEIDLIIAKPDGSIVLIEIKSTTSIQDQACTTLHAFLPSFQNATAMVLSRDKRPKKIGAVY